MKKLMLVGLVILSVASFSNNNKPPRPNRNAVKADIYNVAYVVKPLELDVKKSWVFYGVLEAGDRVTVNPTESGYKKAYGSLSGARGARVKVEYPEKIDKKGSYVLTPKFAAKTRGNFAAVESKNDFSLGWDGNADIAFGGHLQIDKKAQGPFLIHEKVPYTFSYAK